jgi:hypothetical protein
MRVLVISAGIIGSIYGRAVMEGCAGDIRRLAKP